MKLFFIVTDFYGGRILFLTVSQSPNVEVLRQKISGFITESRYNISYWNMVIPMLVILDDVWSESVVQQLMFNVPGCKTVVVSRIKFQSSVLNSSYELELLREEDAISLFCHTAFETTSIPPGTDENLIKQV